MNKIQTILEGAMLGAASIAVNVVTDTKNVIDTIAQGDILPTVSNAVVETSNIPSPDAINTVMNLITQLAILVTTIWKLVKKDKPKKDNQVN